MGMGETFTTINSNFRIVHNHDNNTIEGQKYVETYGAGTWLSIGNGATIKQLLEHIVGVEEMQLDKNVAKLFGMKVDEARTLKEDASRLMVERNNALDKILMLEDMRKVSETMRDTIEKDTWDKAANICIEKAGYFEWRSSSPIKEMMYGLATRFRRGNPA